MRPDPVAAAELRLPLVLRNVLHMVSVTNYFIYLLCGVLTLLPREDFFDVNLSATRDFGR